jgi:hypothetical protein
VDPDPQHCSRHGLRRLRPYRNMISISGKQVGQPLGDEVVSGGGQPKLALGTGTQGPGQEVGQPPDPASGAGRRQLELTPAALAAQHVAAGQQGLEVADGLDDRPGRTKK